jgi:SurA N-terminal domain
MRRTAFAVTAAAAMLVVAPLLSACGSDQHPGAAAVVGGERITVSQLQSHVRAIRDAQASTKGGDQLREKSGGLSRTTLNGMIFDRVIERAAGNQGVEVTRRDVQQMRSAVEQQVGGKARLKTVLLQQFGVAPGGQTDDFIRIQALGAKLQQSLGATDGSPEAKAAMNKALADAAKQLKVDVNPRYGTWDAAKMSLPPAKTPWLKQVTGGGRTAQQQQS